MYLTSSIAALTNTIVAQDTVTGGTAGTEGGVLNGGKNGTPGTAGTASDPNVSGPYVSDDDFIGGNPDLGPLQSNGGPTQTMAPLPGSPVIDKGDNNAANLPKYDQRGDARTINGTVDIGAVEYQYDLSVSISGPTSVQAGQNIAYQITVTNNGPDTAGNGSDDELDDILPGGVTFKSIQAPSGWTTANKNGTITATIPTLASGASATFTLTVQTGDNTPNKVVNTATIGSTTWDNDLSNNISHFTTTLIPTVTGMSSATANGTYGTGSTIDIAVGFGAPVTVTGTPELDLNSGGTASYLKGSGTNTLIFGYTVAAGQNANPLDEASTTALTLNGGTIDDNSNDPANLTLNVPGTAGSLGANKSIVIDTTAPTVTSVSSTTPNGTYGVGAVITITVGFSKPVVVTGTPELALNSGGTADYSSGSGTSTLTFTYTVAAGQNANPLNEASATALTLNGGTIYDTTGTNPNAANLTLPAPGTAGSLGVNKSIVIDTVAPTVVSFNVLFGQESYNLIGSTRYDLPWAITGIQVVFSKPIATGDLNSLTGLTAASLSGLGTNTLTWTLSSPITLGKFATALQGSGNDALKDVAGNALVGGAGFAQNFNVLEGDVNDDGYVSSADMLAVYRAIGQPYNIFDDINGDGVITMADVSLVRQLIGHEL